MSRRVKKILIYVGLFFFAQNLAHAQQAHLKNLVISNTAGAVVISFKLKDAFPSAMKEAILKGTPITFTFLVALYEVRSLWFDKKNS